MKNERSSSELDQMHWVRFYHLNIAEDFFFGKYRFCKTGFFTARTVLAAKVAFVPPWKKVRSARPYGNAAFKPGIFSVRPPAISATSGVLSVVAPPSAHTEQVAGEESRE